MLVMFLQNICALFSEYVLVFLQASAGKYQIQTEKAQSQLDKTQTDYDRLQEKFERGQNEIRKVSHFVTFLPDHSFFITLQTLEQKNKNINLLQDIYSAPHLSRLFSLMLIREIFFSVFRLMLDQKLFSTVDERTFFVHAFA